MMLVTPAPFDRFLAGDDKALTERQKAGLKTFIATGCAGCHNGVNFGGTMMQKFGLTRDYWLETGSPKPDAGRYAITKKEEDSYVFRVPMLRNVAKTAPYFHDGSVSELEWQIFLRDEVTRRFPDGLTVWEAQGQWRTPAGSIDHEQSNVLLLVHPDTVAARQSVMAVIEAYRKSFDQQSVLWESSRVCIAA